MGIAAEIDQRQEGLNAGEASQVVFAATINPEALEANNRALVQFL
ncbi:MAG TPA: hypothetical protein VGP73_08945 [Thermoanaerobaculia bacterium]